MGHLAWAFACSVVLLVASGESLAQEGGLAERRAWAKEMAETASPGALDQVLGALEHEDLALRRMFLRYLGRVELERPKDHKRRLQALAERASSDTDRRLRLDAMEGLAKIGGGPAVEELVGLLHETDRGERAHIARLLAVDLFSKNPEARAAIDELVQGSFRESGTDLDPGVLQILLPAYGRLLAERTDGGATARERAPLLLARRHPSRVVRLAAERGLNLAIARLGELERFEQSERLLRRFSVDGLQPQVLLYLRSMEILEEGGISPEAALTLARELGRSTGQVASHVDGSWRARAALVEANALIALGRMGEASESLQLARELNAGLLARRFDLQGQQGALWQRDLWNASAMVEFTEAFRLVAEGAGGDDLDVLATLRRCHVLLLEAQLLAIQSDLPLSGNLDVLFGASPSPYRCVFAARPHAAWPAPQVLRVQGILGRALASISSREMPGFEPYPAIPAALADPLVDPQRAPLFDAMARARIDAVQREINKLQLKRLKLMDVNPQLDAELNMLSYTMRRMRQDLADLSPAQRFYESRRPSSHGLLFAEALRREDRNLESRQVSQRMSDFIEEHELRQQYSWAVQLAAQTKLMIGGSYSDLGEAAEAEKYMLEGLELFEGLQAFYGERGLAEVARGVDNDLAEALVSLAVNANVKGKQPKRAREYFERAYKLRQDDFMRILLACYRARSGDGEEARELIAEVPDSPRGYYNLACTYALLGEIQRALEYLELDFTVNRTSDAALEKQKAWAREDPDLASLALDPRFLLLTEPTALSPGESVSGEDE